MAIKACHPPYPPTLPPKPHPTPHRVFELATPLDGRLQLFDGLGVAAAVEGGGRDLGVGGCVGEGVRVSAGEGGESGCLPKGIQKTKRQ